jgi:REP element-mobilizing transposase RayT
MPRKLRIQRLGALYHVINRGNYRSDLFASQGASQAFLKALFEAVSRYGWKLHAYVLMRNHYHLALETPLPNLVEGMHWLQGTFSNRFNRFRKQNGHVFQGRYKALILEDKTVLSRVVDYIHLNPVRAGVAAPGHIERFEWSSLPQFLKGNRPAGLVCHDWLAARGGRQDNAKDLKSYLQYLRDIGNNEQEQKKAGLTKLSRGWALGTHGWKQALAREHAHKTFREGLEKEEIGEIKQMHWENALSEALRAAGRKAGELDTKPRLQHWKLEIAGKLRKQTGAPIVWIAKNLHLGKPSTTRYYLHVHRSKN